MEKTSNTDKNVVYEQCEECGVSCIVSSKRYNSTGIHLCLNCYWDD